MNIDRVLQSLAKNEVNYLLIGGVNFLLRHAPEITYDIDVWIASQATLILSGMYLHHAVACAFTMQEVAA